MLPEVVKLSCRMLTVNFGRPSPFRMVLQGCLSILAVACASVPRGTDVTPAGHLLLGQNGAREFGVAPGDTLFERSAGDVPLAVRLAAQETGVRLGYAVDCSRFFSRGETFVVLLVSACQRGDAQEDGEALAAFRTNGSGIGPVLGFATPDDYVEVAPARRVRRPDT